METRQLTHTDLTISRLCMGTMTYGSQVTEADAQRMTDFCLDSGINFFDTANVYNQGLSEEITGRCLGDRRKDVVLATKARGKMDGDDGYAGLAPAAIRRALEDSLRRLNTDYVDLYYLHMPDDSVPIEDSLGTLEELRREGKIRYGSASNYSAWQMCEMKFLADNNGWQPVTVTQPMYNLLARGIEQEYIPFAKKFGASLVVYNPLAGGLLTGKQNLQTGPIAGTRFDKNERYLNRYWHEDYFGAVQGVKAVAENAGRSMVELALRWLMQQEPVDSIILGASSMGHLEANITAAQSDDLSDETMAECDEVWQRLRGCTPFYNR